MAEYIDIDAQVVVTDTRGCEHETTVRHIFEMNKGVYTAADVVERKTGEWCADYDGYADGEPVYDMWWCSACGEYFDEWDDRPTWKYCPNCGAKMIGGDDNGT